MLLREYDVPGRTLPREYDVPSRDRSHLVASVAVLRFAVIPQTKYRRLQTSLWEHHLFPQKLSLEERGSKIDDISESEFRNI